MSWNANDVLKLIEVLKKYEIVWKWKKYLERDFYKIIDVVTEISSLVNKTNQEVLQQVEILWKRLLQEYIAYNNKDKDTNYVQWKYTNDFMFIFRDINDALQVWRKLHVEMLNFPSLFDENFKDVKARTKIFATIVNEEKYKTKYSGVLKPNQLIALVTYFKYSDCKQPFPKLENFDIKKFPRIFHTPNEPRFQLPSFYLKLWDLVEERKRKKPISSLVNCEVVDYDPEIHPDLSSIEINGLLANIAIVDNKRDKYDNENIFQLLFLFLSFHAVNNNIYNFLDDSIEVQNIWKTVVESFENAGYPFKTKELINFWKYIVVRARNNAEKYRQDPDRYALSNLDLEINYVFPESKTEHIRNITRGESICIDSINYKASTSSETNVAKCSKEETITSDPNEMLSRISNKSTRTDKCVIDLTDIDKPEEESLLIEDSSDDDCKISINWNN